MPRTFVTFLICTGALIGIFPLAGFWSKDEILAGRQPERLSGDARPSGIIGAFMTAAYMTRCLYLTFFGEPRGAAKEHEHHLHESGPRIVVPLIILAGLAIVAGFVNLPDTGALSLVPERIALRFEHYVQPTGAAYFPDGDRGRTSRSPWRSSPRRWRCSASGWRTSTGSRAGTRA